LLEVEDPPDRIRFRRLDVEDENMIWTPGEYADDVLKSAVALATFAAASPTLDARPAVRREVLRMYVLPLVTQGTLPGKGQTRYVSAGAAGRSDERLEHEHVYTRSYLADLILANPRQDAVQWILTNLAIAATVTRTEHTRLTRVPKSVQGWDRYRVAGVPVTDLATGLPVTENPLIPDWIRHPGQPAPSNHVALPADALDQLLATSAFRDLLDPEVTDLPGARDWPTRRAEAFECISIVAHAAGHRFESAAAARQELFAHAVGGGFGIRDWLQDAVEGLLVSIAEDLV
jgi:hypothetical protein